MTKRLECPLCGGELQCEGSGTMILLPRIENDEIIFEMNEITDYSFDFLYCCDCHTEFSKEASWAILNEAFNIKEV